jgi:predicted outer membrane repeat protein
VWLSGPGCVPSWRLRIRQAGSTGDEILPARGYRDKGRDWCGLLSGLFFYVGGHSSSAKSGGAISSTGYVVPQSFTAGGN